MDEFSVIEKYFAPLTMGNAGAADLRDDGAVISVPQGYELAITSDTLNEGVHFMIGESPDAIARKALRVNLSDLASMGAKPLCYQLNIAFPHPPEEPWLAAFSRALLEENTRFGVFCSGGDTTGIKSEYLSISITALGVVPVGKALRRGGAKDGDFIVLTGAIGDAALGLRLLLNGKEGACDPAYKSAIMRSRIPEPRVGVEDVLRAYVHAAADLSDGLVADCMHVARASGLGLLLDLEALEFSPAVNKAIKNGDISPEEVVRAGDDYELILAVSAGCVDNLLDGLRKNKLKPQLIGRFVDNGLKLEINETTGYRISEVIKGWKHF